MAQIAALLLGGVLLLIGWGSYLEYVVRYWDQKIATLCAAEGGRNVGLRVYERVMVPEHYIRPASGASPADVRVPWRYQGKVLKPDEPIVMELVELEVLRKSSPRVSKYSSRIVRVADSKVLVEEIKYMRSGGGIPMPTPGETIRCPADALTPTGTYAINSAAFINYPSIATSKATK